MPLKKDSSRASRFAKAVGADGLEVITDRSHFMMEEIKSTVDASVTAYVPKSLTPSIVR